MLKLKLQEQGLVLGISGEGQVGDFVVEGADGQVGHVEIKAENVTTGAPEVEPATILEMGTVTIDITKQWKDAPEGIEYYLQRKQQRQEDFARRYGNSNKCSVLSRNGEEIKPPVEMKQLIW